VTNFFPHLLTFALLFFTVVGSTTGYDENGRRRGFTSAVAHFLLLR
jgi:hypothetical protein